MYDASNRRWKTIRSISATGATRYESTITSFNESWLDTNANFTFRIFISITIDAFNNSDISYSQGKSVQVTDWCVGATAQLSLSEAKLTHQGQTYDLLNGQKPTLFSNGGNPHQTEIETTTVSVGGINFGPRQTRVETFISDRSTLGAGPIQTRELGFSPIANLHRVPKGTEVFRRSNFRILGQYGSFRLKNNTTYYLHALIYDVGTITPPLSQGTHHYVWPFTYKFSDDDGRGGSPICPICPDPIDDGEEDGDDGPPDNRIKDVPDYLLKSNTRDSSYKISIFDLTGQKILTATVSNKEEENLIIADLPKKIYIIKTKNGDRKIQN
ncbi:MAG: T9SS type A sorting domain-containing protein [Cyanobacteria bacterium P01_A01_bin.84]